MFGNSHITVQFIFEFFNAIKHWSRFNALELTFLNTLKQNLSLHKKKLLCFRSHSFIIFGKIVWILLQNIISNSTHNELESVENNDQMSTAFKYYALQYQFGYRVLGLWSFEGDRQTQCWWVLLSDPFRGMRGWRNSTYVQQPGHAPRSGPEVKDGRSKDKDSAPKRLRYGTVRREVS